MRMFVFHIIFLFSSTVIASEGFHINKEDMGRHISILSSDEFLGRAPATQGGAKTKDYIASHFKKFGLLPGNGNSFYQTVNLVESSVLPGGYLEISQDSKKRRLQLGSECVYATKRLVENINIEKSEMIFVGFGIVAPEYGWNDYKNLDVRGKTVVILVNDPGFWTEDPNLFKGKAMTYYGRWTYKYEEAARQGAAAVLIIHETEPAAYPWGVVENSFTGPQIDLIRSNLTTDRVKLEGWITYDVAVKLFSDAGLDLEEYKMKALSANFQAADMGDLQLNANFSNSIRTSNDENLIGIVKGKNRPDEYILYMAHWDHLGQIKTQDSLDNIYNGAVDNATGVAAILEIAEAFSDPDTRPDRSIIFLAVTAEESGLLGSAFFAENPAVPLSSIVGGINFDALFPTGPARDITVVGLGSSEMEDILRAIASKSGRYLVPESRPEWGIFFRSDHISLAKKGVPMLYLDSGIDLIEGGKESGMAYVNDYTTNRYHKPSDEYSKDWDLRSMVEDTKLGFSLGLEIANSEVWPNWYQGNEFRSIRDAQMEDKK